jgi:NADH dehydrogenase
MNLVVGATGRLGGMITQQLLGQGKDVRILVRHDSPSEEMARQGMATPVGSLIEAGAQPVYGDLKDRASLDAACEGVETVITTANSALRGGEDNVQTIEFEGNHNLIEAAKAAGVKHFVFTSVLGASPDSPVPFVQGKAKTEERLRASGIDYTILAPNVFMEVWVGMVIGGPLQAGQPVTLVGEAKRKHSLVSMADVAAFATASVDNPAARNAHLPIGGPKAMSWREIVAACSQVVGRDLPVQFVAVGEPVPGVPEAVQPLMWGLETYDSVVDMEEIARTYGVDLTPLEVVADRMFGGAGT